MSADRDLFVTSREVIWSFESEDHGTVFAVTAQCDEYGNTETDDRVKTPEGIYYKHDDWKTGDSIENAIRTFCENDEDCEQRILHEMREIS